MQTTISSQKAIKHTEKESNFGSLEKEKQYSFHSNRMIDLAIAYPINYIQFSLKSYVHYFKSAVFSYAQLYVNRTEYRFISFRYFAVLVCHLCACCVHCVPVCLLLFRISFARSFCFIRFFPYSVVVQLLVLLLYNAERVLFLFRWFGSI